jgi:hypothetical protein
VDVINPINTQALAQLNRARNILTRQQFKTLRGQILAGEYEAALKGLQKIKERRPIGRESSARQGPGDRHRQQPKD